MKMQIAAICYTERELEAYVGQLRQQGFESLSEIKKAEDGSFYLLMCRGKSEHAPEKPAEDVAESVLVAGPVLPLSPALI